MPIVQLFNRASEIASAALCSQRPEDLELAFSGEARSAFLWMQCFLHDEEEWCRSLACPGTIIPRLTCCTPLTLSTACIVTQTLSTESTIRMTMTATLLSKADYDVASPNTQAALPSFAFFLPSLKHATTSDPFWGPEYTSFLLQRAEKLESGLQTLIAQLGELEALVTSPTTSPKRVSTQPILQKEAVQGTKIRKSRLAKRQLRLYWEEQAMLKRLAEQAWGAVVLKDTTTMEQRAFLRAVARGKPGFGRRRSLTCP